jgi:hypothetical protein
LLGRGVSTFLFVCEFLYELGDVPLEALGLPSIIEGLDIYDGGGQQLFNLFRGKGHVKRG